MKYTCFIKIFVAAVAIMTSFQVFSQNTEKPGKFLTLAAFTNSTSLPDIASPGILNHPIHPGFVAGLELPYKKGENYLFFQTVKLGFFYHHLAQTAIQLYSELGYRHNIINNFSLDAKLSAGYLHSVPGIDIFSLNESGQYVKTSRWGRPQAMAGLNIGINYEVKQMNKGPMTVFFNYHFWFQFPFVKSYVPVLPNSSYYAGVSFPVLLNFH